jgi:hypothetical protein
VVKHGSLLGVTDKRRARGNRVGGVGSAHRYRRQCWVARQAIGVNVRGRDFRVAAELLGEVRGRTEAAETLLQVLKLLLARRERGRVPWITGRGL